MDEPRTKRPLGSSLLTPGDRELIRRINDTAVSHPATPLLDRFAEAVRRRPDKPALVHEREGRVRSLTYAELDREANRWARRLLHDGMRPGEVAAICMAPQEGMLLAALAILKAGGAYLPIDASFPSERVAFLLDDSGARFVFTSRESAALLDGPAAGRAVFAVDGEEGPGALSAESPGVRRAPESACYVIYTSGSTGRPKGVVVADRSLLNFTWWYDAECGFSAEEDSATGVFVSFAFDSQVSTTLVPLLSGATVHVGRADLIGDFEGFLGYLDRHRVTSIMLTPSYMNMIVNALDPARFPLASLRYLMLGAERASAEVCRRWLGTHPAHRIIHRYGPTEGTVACTSVRLEAGTVEGFGDSIPIGRPIPNARIHVVHARGGICPPRVKGEIQIGGAAVTRGYLGRPDLTAERFVPDPWSGEAGARLYRTGDLGSYTPAGTIAFHGRGDDQVKIRGYRVELTEVEHHLKQHPGVELAAALATEDTGAGDRRLVAFYTARDPEVTPEEIRRFLRGRVPEFMVPAHLHRLAAMPLLQHGKIDRRRLLRLEIPAAAEEAAAAEDAVAAEPASDLERRVAAVAARALEIERVPLHTSFFDLGANSLTIARLHHLLAREMPGRVSLAEIFGHASVARLAGLLAAKEAPARGAEPPARRSLVPAGKGRIAIIGMAGRFPGARDLDELWDNLAAGRCHIGPLPEGRLRILQRDFPRPLTPELFGRGGYLDEIDRFDPLFFHISPGEAEVMDPQQRLFLEVVYEALEAAGRAGEEIFGSDTGVFISDSVNQYGLMIPRFEGAALPGNRPSVIAGRVAYMFDLHGPTFTVDTACSSGLVALHLACKALRDGECDLALVGGSDLIVAPNRKLNPFADAGINSKTEELRPFDAGADGTVRGEAVAALLIKPLERALADGDHVWAVIEGSAVNHDGFSNGVTAPNPVAQARAIVRALESAGVDAEALSYIEGHGSGTRLGDPIEIEGVTAAFRRSTDRRGFCPIGSIKANVGHVNNLAGLAGLVKVVLALRARIIPPAVGFERPNPYIDFAGAPVFVSPEGMAWEPPPGQPRRAGINSFGLSGTNVHTVVAEAPAAPPRAPETPRPAVFVLSARTDAALRELLGRWRRWLAAHPEAELRDLALVSTTGRGHFRHRLAVVASTRQELDAGLERLEGAGADPERGLFAGRVEGVESPRTFFTLETAEEPVRLDRGEATVDLLRGLAARWVEGTPVLWKLLADPAARRLPLPTYPFERRSCWIADTRLQAKLLEQVVPPEILAEPVPVAPRQAEAAEAAGFRLAGRPDDESYTAMESRVAAGWARVLKIDEVSIDESFFNLGNSLMMMQLGADLRETIGLPFPPIKLARLPTIHRFAQYLEGLAGEPGSAPAPAAEADLAPLVRLGESAAGDLSLVFFPFSGGEPSAFYQVVRHLPDSIATWALAVPRNDGIANLESLVDLVLEPVGALIRRGPTVLFGHSMGGLLAHRLTQKLEAAGTPPAALIVSAASAAHFDAAEKRAMIETSRQMEGLSDGELLAEAVRLGLMRPDDAAALAGTDLARNLRFDLELTFEFVPAAKPRTRTRSWLFAGADDPLAATMPRWEEVLGAVERTVTLPGGHLYPSQSPELLARELEAIAAGLTGRPLPAPAAEAEQVYRV